MKQLQVLLLQGVLLQWCYLFLCSSTAESSPLGGSHRNVSCGNGYYYDTNTSDCNECSTCSPGEGTVQPCTNISNTICTQCQAWGMRSILHAATGSWKCENCTNCTQAYRIERTACNDTSNSVCGGCVEGFFLGVGRDGVTSCMKCSRCPPESGRRITRWRDCQEAGLDRNMWCSPGYAEPATVATQQLLQNMSEGLEPARKRATTVTMPIVNSTLNDTTLYVGGKHFLPVPNNSEEGRSDAAASHILVISAAACLSLAAPMCTLIGGVLCGLKAIKHCHPNSTKYHRTV